MTHALVDRSFPADGRECGFPWRPRTVGAADLAALGIAAEPPVGVAHPTGPDLPAAVERLEEAMIRRALVESGGNRAEAARRLNINRQLLYQKIKKYGIDLDK